MNYFDLVIKEFSDKIINEINESILPLEVKRLVMLEICQKLEKESNKIINMQALERERARAEEGEAVE